jgi:hypothetical protein
MLADADIERWSRQILLPEVGGRGQERLMATRVAITGDGPVAGIARDLLVRAGVRTTSDGGDVVVSIGGPCPATTPGTVLVRATVYGAGGSVWTLVGRPCGVCLDDAPIDAITVDHVLDGIAAQALGALVANEVLCAVLVPPARGRGHRLDLATGRYEAATPRAAHACDVCGGDA